MLVLLTLIIAIVIVWALRESQKPIGFPPGPPKRPFFGSYSSMVKPGEKNPNLFWAVRKFAKEYGKTFGFYLGGKPYVVLTDYHDIKEAFKRDELSGRGSNEPYNMVRPGWHLMTKIEPDYNKGRAPGVVGSNGRYWREQRRFLLRNLRDFGFGKSSMEDALRQEVKKLIQFLEPEVGKPFNLNQTANISIVNSLWGILVGETFQLGDPQLKKILNSFDDLLKRRKGGLAAMLLTFLPYKPMALWPGIKQITGYDQIEEVYREISVIISKYIKDHKANYDEDNIKDFMDLYLSEISNTKDQESSFYKETGDFSLLNNVIDLFFAGTETTSSSLLWTILYLLHYPDVQDKVHAEIDKIVGTAQDRLPSLADKPSMHYTNAVLLESLRLTSFVPLSVPHCALQDLVINDYSIPKGATVLPSLFHVMHDPGHFANPEDFNPQRFLTPEGHFVPDDRVVPFGMGKRYCLGQSLAEKEFFLFFTGLLQRFEFKKVPGKALPSYDIEDTAPRGILRSAPNYEVLLELRK